jgi:7-carboxy-7-deazaguanine synthase
MSVDEILSEVGRIGGDCRLVELTGGEPLLQHDIGDLAQRLLESGYTVLCETSGSLPVDRVPPDVVKIVDLKPPGSGEESSNDWGNLAMQDPRELAEWVLADGLPVRVQLQVHKFIWEPSARGV